MIKDFYSTCVLISKIMNFEWLNLNFQQYYIVLWLYWNVYSEIIIVIDYDFVQEPTIKIAISH